MATCSNCKKNIEEKILFCPYCGTRIKSEKSTDIIMNVKNDVLDNSKTGKTVEYRDSEYIGKDNAEIIHGNKEKKDSETTNYYYSKTDRRANNRTDRITDRRADRSANRRADRNAVNRADTRN